MLRLLGYANLAVAAFAATRDALAFDRSGHFMIRPISQHWFEIDRESWLQLQPAVERHLHQDLWFSVFDPVLSQPALPFFAVIGLGFLVSARLLRRG